MGIQLKGRHFLKLKDFTPAEIGYLLDLSKDLKAKKRGGTPGDLLRGKSIVLLFDKPSTRTRCAFEVAAFDEGAHVTFLSDSHMGHKESLEDTAKVLGTMYDGIEFRGFQHETVELLAKHAGVPVWNGLTDQYHPTQALADLLTIQEYVCKPLNQVKIVYVGDTRNNVAHSLIVAAAKFGMHFIGLGPQSLYTEENFFNDIQHDINYNQAKIEFSSDIEASLKNADVIYTDVWVSMGEEQQWAERIEALLPYQVNQAMLDHTENPNIIFMHCLPAYHDIHTKVGQQMHEQFGLDAMEVTDEVFRSKHSVVFEQAGNRLHTIKAVMVATIGAI